MFLALLLFVLLNGDEYSWKPTCQPDQVSLWKSGRQIGVVEIATGKYQALDNGRFAPADCPVSIPEQFGGPKPKPATETRPAEKPICGRVDPHLEKPGAGVRGFSSIVDSFAGPILGAVPAKPETPNQEPPAEKPADKKDSAEKPAGTVNFGLDKTEFPSEGEYFAYNGAPIDKAAAEQLLFGGKVKPDALVDDSQALRLTIVGDDGATKTAIETLKKAADWPEISQGVLVADYPAGHWALEGKGYQVPGVGTVGFYLTDANGKLLYEGTDPGGLLDGLRRQKNRPIGIDFNSWWVGFSPLTWMFGLGASSFHLPVEFILLTVAAVVAGVVILRKTKNPKGA